MTVSMPSVGQSSFLLYSVNSGESDREIVCQCPQSGNPHFYRIKLDNLDCVISRVNALSRAILISTKGTMNNLFESLNGVNALSRAILISTKYG